MTNQNPYLTPAADLEASPDGATRIEMAPVSGAWKHKFRLIEKAGGVKLPRFKDLAFGERMRVSFNILAYLFGPFYYAAKGMWRKGLALLGVCLAVGLLAGILLELAGLGHVARFLGYGLAAVFATRANIDFYKKHVAGDNGWW